MDIYKCSIEVLVNLPGLLTAVVNGLQGYSSRYKYLIDFLIIIESKKLEKPF